MMQFHETRESWLSAAVELLRAEFQSQNWRCPTVRVSCSFPDRGAMRRDGSPNVIGQCWSPKATAGDNRHHIQITPMIDDAAWILEVLVHELVHATVGTGAGHGHAFKACAESMLLTGKMTATVASEWGKVWLQSMAGHLGPYPHTRIDLTPFFKQSPAAPGDPEPEPGPIDGPRRRKGSPLKKCECSACGYLARVTLKWLETVGAPLCPCNGQPMEW